jgi:hypothetical protein
MEGDGTCGMHQWQLAATPAALTWVGGGVQALAPETTLLAAIPTPANCCCYARVIRHASCCGL